MAVCGNFVGVKLGIQHWEFANATSLNRRRQPQRAKTFWSLVYKSSAIRPADVNRCACPLLPSKKASCFGEERLRRGGNGAKVATVSVSREAVEKYFLF